MLPNSLCTGSDTSMQKIDNYESVTWEHSHKTLDKIYQTKFSNIDMIISWLEMQIGLSLKINVYCLTSKMTKPLTVLVDKGKHLTNSGIHL